MYKKRGTGCPGTGWSGLEKWYGMTQGRDGRGTGCPESFWDILTLHPHNSKSSFPNLVPFNMLSHIFTSHKLCNKVTAQGFKLNTLFQVYYNWIVSKLLLFSWICRNQYSFVSWLVLPLNLTKHQVIGYWWNHGSLFWCDHVNYFFPLRYLCKAVLLRSI